MGVAVSIEGLTKTYHLFMQKEPVNAVEDLNLEVYEGEIFGFLGPNGAGKTTTIKMLLGLTYPTAGRALVLGKPAGHIDTKNRISYLPESPYFYDYMTGEELLHFFGGLFRLNSATRQQKVEELLKIVGLHADRRKPLTQYSRGMLQRIGIAQALINDPTLLFFDEPTSGLDPIAHMEIRDLILRLRDEGKTVFLSSHQLSDVEMVCDRVAILNRGKLLRVGKLAELLGSGQVEITAEGLDETTVKKLRDIGPCTETTDGCLTLLQPAGQGIGETVDLIRSANGGILSIIPQRQTLEDLFMEVIREESQ